MGGGDLDSDLGDGSFMSVDASKSDLDQTVELDDLIVVLAQKGVPLKHTSLDETDLDSELVDESEVVILEVTLSTELMSAVSEFDVKVCQSRLMRLNLFGVFIAVFLEPGKSHLDRVDVGLGIGDLAGKSGDQSGVQ